MSMTKTMPVSEVAKHIASSLQTRVDAIAAATGASPLRRTSKSVYWAPSPISGRGLFANEDIAPGELIVVSPALVVDRGELNTLLTQYAFILDRSSGTCTNTGSVGLVFGPTSICNHSDEPNAKVTFSDRDNSGVEAELCSVRQIRPDEEIVIRYADASLYKAWGRI